MAEYLGREETGTVARQSLMADLEKCNEHAREILETVRRLNDTLHGAVPRDANVKGNTPPEPTPTMRRQLDKMQSLLASVDEELRGRSTWFRRRRKAKER